MTVLQGCQGTKTVLPTSRKRVPVSVPLWLKNPSFIYKACTGICSYVSPAKPKFMLYVGYR